MMGLIGSCVDKVKRHGKTVGGASIGWTGGLYGLYLLANTIIINPIADIKSEQVSIGKRLEKIEAVQMVEQQKHQQGIIPPD